MSHGVSRRWTVLAVASALIFMTYFMQYQVSAFAYSLMPTFGLDTVRFSSLFFAPMLTAVFLSIPLGTAADRLGVRIVVGACAIMALGGAVLRVLAADYATLLVSLVMIGFAPAALNANFMRLLGAWFTERSSIAIGVYYAASGLGTATALVSSAFLESAGTAFALAAEVFLVVTVLWWMLVADSPNGAFRGASNQTLAFVGTTARSRSVWYVALVTGFGLAAKMAFLGFLPQALQASIGPGGANALAAAVTYGGIVGCVLGPLVCARRRHPKAFVTLCAVTAAVLMAVTGATLDSPSAILLFLVGLSTSVTAPIVEAIPCVLPEIRRCIGSAGGIIGTVSLAMTYVIPLGITAAAGEDYPLIVCLTAGCFLLTIPFVLLLPSLSPRAASQEGGCAD